jgi:hypothetical protein
MDTHHLAFVRFVTSLRKIHTAAVLPGGIGDELAGIGEQMDRDWSELTPTQQREVELLSTEIAWRSEVSNSKLKENIKNFTTFPAVSEPPPEQVHDIEPTAISALIDNSV